MDTKRLTGQSAGLFGTIMEIRHMPNVKLGGIKVPEDEAIKFLEEMKRHEMLKPAREREDIIVEPCPGIRYYEGNNWATMTASTGPRAVSEKDRIISMFADWIQKNWDEIMKLPGDFPADKLGFLLAFYKSSKI